jgi:hypothetical protein
MLPLVLAQEHIDKLMADARAGKEIEVDLPAQVVRRPNGEEIPFEVESFRKVLSCRVGSLNLLGLIALPGGWTGRHQPDPARRGQDHRVRGEAFQGNTMVRRSLGEREANSYFARRLDGIGYKGKIPVKGQPIKMDW